MSRRAVLPVLAVVALVLSAVPALAVDPRLQGAPPGPPTDLRAASLDRAVSLDWDAATGGAPAATYAVHRQLLGGADGAVETLVAQTVDTRYRDETPGLLNGRSYVYSVRASSTTGAQSAPVRVSVTPRAPVSGQAQQAPALRGELTAAGDMELDWTPAPHPVDAFVLHRRNVSQGEQFGHDGAGTAIYSGSGLSHLDDYPYDTAETYGFAVQTQVNGVLGPLSDEVLLAQPPGFPPSDPITLQAEATLQQTVLLTWNTVEYGKEYLLFKEDSPGSGTYSLLTTRVTRTLEASGSLTHEDQRVSAQKTYRYYVLCYGSQVGGRVQSNDASAVALPWQRVAPRTPSETLRLVEEVRPETNQMVLYAVPGTDQVEVRWNPVPEAVSYEIQGGPLFGPDGLPSRERFRILADGIVTTSFRHRRTDDVPWVYFGYWLDRVGFAGAATKYQSKNLAYGRRANVPGSQADQTAAAAGPPAARRSGTRLLHVG